MYPFYEEDCILQTEAPQPLHLLTSGLSFHPQQSFRVCDFNHYSLLYQNLSSEIMVTWLGVETPWKIISWKSLASVEIVAQVGRRKGKENTFTDHVLGLDLEFYSFDSVCSTVFQSCFIILHRHQQFQLLYTVAKSE